MLLTENRVDVGEILGDYIADGGMFIGGWISKLTHPDSQVCSPQGFITHARGTSLMLRAMLPLLRQSSDIQSARYTFRDAAVNMLLNYGVIVPPALCEQLRELAKEEATKLGPAIVARWFAFHAAPTPKHLEINPSRHEFIDEYTTIWRETLTALPLDALTIIIEHTISCLERAVRTMEAAGHQGSLAQNLDWLQSKLGFGAPGRAVAQDLMEMSSINHDQPFRQKNSFSNLLASSVGILADEKSSTHSIATWLAALGHTKPAVDATLGVKGWLRTSGLVEAKDSSLMSLMFPPIHTAYTMFLTGMDPTTIEERLINLAFWSSAPDPSHDAELASFAYLGRDLANLRAMTACPTPLRALLLGPKGSGKTALCAALARDLGRTARAVRWETSNGDQLLDDLGLAQSLSNIAGNVLVTADIHCLDVNTISVLADRTRHVPSNHEIWCAATIETIPASLLGLFDLVVYLPSMPLTSRRALASKLFDDQTSAHLVAQSTSLPGEIVSLANWARQTKTHDWAALSSCLAGLQQAQLAHKKTTGSLPITIHAPGANRHGFADVVGQPEHTKKARSMIQALLHPERYRAMGVKAPKGLLLTGAPGNGKTHLARAMAAEAGVPLLVADSAALAETPEGITAVFSEARKQSPCILFLDEIDALGAKSKGAMGASPDPKRQAILNRLLTELDGFDGLEGVLVIGATHRAELLDDALMRSGRLGHRIHFDSPDRASRRALWQYYTRTLSLDTELDWDMLARSSTGMSPADIAQAANDAGLRAVAEDSASIGMPHLIGASDEIVWGACQEHLPMLEDERYRTAVHEAGHAMLAWHHRMPMDRVSVRPRASTLGMVRLLPEEGRYARSQSSLWALMSMSFGGLVAETTVFGSHGTGASSDLDAIRSHVRNAVRVEGMDANLPAGVSRQFEAPTSEATLRRAERVEHEIIQSAKSHATSWLNANSETLETLAKLLAEQREIDGPAVEAYLDSRLSQADREQATDNNAALSMAARASRTRAAD